MTCHRVLVAFIAFVAFVALVPSAWAVTIETVPVGNPGNAPKSYSGSVEYSYRLGKYEVTNAEYVEFLNSVDPTGANKLALYNSRMSTDPVGGVNFNTAAVNGTKYTTKPDRGSNPVVFVSYFDTLRFTNWLHNSQGSGSTESGAYTLPGGNPQPTNVQSIARNPGARWWLPNQLEHYKAAFHKNDGVTANYWHFPFSSDAIPVSDQPPGGNAPLPSNTGNFFQDDQLANGYNDGYAVTGSPMLSNTQNYLTNVGAYPLSRSPYGAFDLGGNVEEWYDADSTSFVGWGGGAWSASTAVLGAPSNFGSGGNPLAESATTGFRVGAMPESAGAHLGSISVDFDSAVGLSANTVGSGAVTKPGFLSWNATWAFNYPFNGGPLNSKLETQFFAQGIEFDLQAFRPGTGGLETPNYLGSRDRFPYQGQPDDLLRDFVFAEASPGTFLYLTISDLPVGKYRMTSWHYDSSLGSTNSSNFMQIEVGDKQAGSVAAATTVVADHFPFGTAPQVFEFEITSPKVVKEIVFRNDDTVQFPGAGSFRTRLNGFTLVQIPEPCTCLSLLTALSLLSLCCRRAIACRGGRASLC